jgi:hypothetical protein
VGLRAAETWKPGPALESAASDRKRNEIARRHRRRSFTAECSSGPRRHAPPLFGRPRASTGGPGRGVRVLSALENGIGGVGGPTGTRFKKQAESPVSACTHRPDRSGVRHALWRTTARGSARSGVRPASPTPGGVPRGVKRRAAGRSVAKTSLTRRSTGTRRRV